MTVKRTWVVENTWVCTSCNESNLGRFMACQKCGSPKEANEQDIVPDANSAPEVADPELIRLANEGANWICEFCGGQVRDEFGKCVKNCGAPKPVPPGPQPHRIPEGESKPLPRPMLTGVPGPGMPREFRAPKNYSKLWTPVFWGVGGISFVGGIVWLCIYLFASHPENAKVSEIHWTYRQELHERVTKHGEGWGSPFGSFNVSCTSRFYGTEKCHPHNCHPHSVEEECNCSYSECNCHKSCSSNKNGFSTCSEECDHCKHCSTCSHTEYDTCYDQCNVYKDWCAYDYYEWPVIAERVTMGSAHNEYWGDLHADGQLQRLDQSQEYTVSFSGQPDVWTYSPRSLSEFRYFNTGTTWKILVNRVGTVQPIQALP